MQFGKRGKAGLFYCKSGPVKYVSNELKQLHPLSNRRNLFQLGCRECEALFLNGCSKVF